MAKSILRIIRLLVTLLLPEKSASSSNRSSVPGIGSGLSAVDQSILGRGLSWMAILASSETAHRILLESQSGIITAAEFLQSGPAPDICIHRCLTTLSMQGHQLSR